MTDPTADLQQQLADHEWIRTNKTQNVSLTLSKEARRWNSRNQGSSHLTVWQWLTRAHRVQAYLTTMNSKTDKQEILATIQNFRRRQERYRPKQTQPTLQGPSSMTMWVWFRVHAHITITSHKRTSFGNAIFTITSHKRTSFGNAN